MRTFLKNGKGINFLSFNLLIDPVVVTKSQGNALINKSKKFVF